MNNETETAAEEQVAGAAEAAVAETAAVEAVAEALAPALAETHESLPQQVLSAPALLYLPAIGTVAVQAETENLPSEREAAAEPVGDAAAVEPAASLGLSVLAVGGLVMLLRDGRRQGCDEAEPMGRR